MFHKYPYADFHEMNLDWFLNKFKSVLTEWATIQTDFDDLDKSVESLKNFFNTLDVQQEINDKINELYQSGELTKLIGNINLFDLTCVKTGQQGDCFLVKYLDKIIMVDTGYNDDETPISEAINNYGDHVDYLIITHFDPDHVNGILNNYFVEYFDDQTTVFIGIHEQTGVSWYNQNITSVIDILTQLGCEIVYPTEGYTYRLGEGAYLKFNNTVMDPAYDVSTEDGLNDLTLFTTFICGNKRMIFTGDSNKASQRVVTPLMERADIMTIPHHGGYYSIYKPFISAIKPNIAVACDDHATASEQGRPSAGSKRQLIDDNIDVYTTITSGYTFEINVNVGNINTNARAYLPNDILNANMINDDALTTITTNLSDADVFDSLNTYQRMFSSFRNQTLAADNRLLLNNRVNNVFGYRGQTGQRVYRVNTIYDGFDVMSYDSGGVHYIKSFSFEHLEYEITNGVITAATKRDLSDLTRLNDDNSFTLLSVRPMLLYISNADDSVENGVSILTANNVSIMRLTREVGETQPNNVSALFGSYNATYHLDNMTATTFKLHIIVM